MEARRPTVRDALENKKQSMTEALADVQAAIDALDANPEVSKVLELLARAGTRL
jgi:vacuolar-type H+-ATPase subunit E/Vma4